MGAVHGTKHVALLHPRTFTLFPFALSGRLHVILDFHDREHGVLVVRQVPGLPVEVHLRQGRRGDPFITVRKLEILGVALELVPDHRALGQPEGQAFSNGLVDVVDVQLSPQLLVVPSLRFFVGVHVGVELFLGLKGPSVDARHHHVAGITTPIGAGEAAQLEGIPGDGLRGIHVGPFAHIHEGTIAIEGQLGKVVTLK